MSRPTAEWDSCPLPPDIAIVLRSDSWTRHNLSRKIASGANLFGNLHLVNDSGRCFGGLSGADIRGPIRATQATRLNLVRPQRGVSPLRSRYRRWQRKGSDKAHLDQAPFAIAALDKAGDLSLGRTQ